MLILDRKKGEVIQIGEDIQVIVHKIGGTKVWLGIIAPKHIEITRPDAVKKEPDDE